MSTRRPKRYDIDATNRHVDRRRRRRRVRAWLRGLVLVRLPEFGDHVGNVS